MDEDMIILVDYDNICRLCLLSTGAMSDIYAKHGDKSMQQQILCITGLATEEGDGLPSKICQQCRHVVEQACELRDVVDKTTKILARTAVGSNLKQCDVDHDNEKQSNINDDDDADTVIIESYENGTQYVLQDETVIEEYNVHPESNDTDLEIIENGQTAHFEKRVLTEIPVKATQNKSNGKRSPPDMTCQLCLDRFATKEEVRPHVENHYLGFDLQIYLDITSRPFICTWCDEVQLNKPQLVKHHRRHLGINPYVCKHPGCTYVGKNRDGIRHHRVVHSAPSRECATCGAAFRRRSDLVTHTVRAHPAAPRARLSATACAACHLSTGGEPALRRHMKAHHFAPRFPCPYGSCERAYRSAMALRDHERAHRGRRRYRCPLCNRDDFPATSTLKRHLKSHSRSSLCACKLCPATFELGAALRRHRIAHHSQGPQPHRCTTCYQGYESEAELNKHEQTCQRLQVQTNGQTDTQHCMEMHDQVAG